MSSIIKIISIVLFVALLQTTQSCNDDPSSIGIDIDSLEIYSIDSETDNVILSSRSFRKGFASYNGMGRFFLGKTNDIHSVAVIRFGADSSVAGAIPSGLAGIDPNRISNVKLNLKPLRYSIGDTLGGSFSLKVRELIKPIFATADYDTLFPNGFGESNFFNSEILGNYNSSIQLKDTMPDIGIELDKSILLRWFQNARDRDSSFFSYALGLLPDENCNVVHQFRDRAVNETGANLDSLRPYITFLYLNDEGQSVEVKLLSRLVMDVTGAKLPDDGFIYAQSGSPLRGEISFDLSRIPQFSAILSTRLELHLAPEKCLVGNQGLDSVLPATEITNQDGTYSSLPFLGERVEGSDLFLFPSITSAVERWNRADGKGKITLISAKQGLDGNERRYLDRFAFHGVNTSDTTKRPRLFVIYAKRRQL